MRLRWLLAVCLGLLPCTARATSFAPVTGDVPTYYTGVDYRYQILYTDTFNVQTINVDVLDYLDVTSIDCGAGPAFTMTSLAGCGAGPPYNCAAVACPGGSGVQVSLSTSGTVQMVKFYLPGGGQNVNWPTLTLAVRLHDSAGGCGVPSMNLLDNSNNNVYGSAIVTPGAENTACVNSARPTVVSLQTIPTPLTVKRASTASPTTWQVQAKLSNGNSVPFNYPLSDATAFGAAMQCAQGTGAYGSCTTAPFTNYMQVSGTGDFPASLSATAVNAVNPPSGNANLQITAPYLSPLVIPLVVEQNVAVLDIAETTNRTGGPAGEAVVFNVTGAQNAAGGEEPRTATFAVTSTTGPVALSTVQSWLTPNGAGSAAFQAPANLTANQNIVLTATHANPDASTTVQTMPWQILVGNANGTQPPAGTCGLQASPATVGPGETTLVTLQVTPTNGSAPYTAPFAPEWSVMPANTATRVSQTNTGLYVTAPMDANDLSISATFTSSLCSNTSANLDVAVEPDVRLHLTADANRVSFGALWHLNAQVENNGSHPLDGLVLALIPNTGLRAVQSVPMGAGPTAHAATGPKQALWFTAPVPAAGLGPNLSAAFLPMASFACGTISATLVAYRDINATEPFASTSVQAQVRCDPEFDQATLVGRVFVDLNGDGRPQDDEPGLANVMVATSAGIYARTDATGRYHIARLQPGRQAVKVNAATLPVGAYVPTRLDAPSSADGRTEVTLTGGVFRQVNFPVRLPDLTQGAAATAMPAASGVTMDANGLAYRARINVAPGWRLIGNDGVAATPVDPGATAWDVLFPVAPTTRHYPLVAQAADGRTELSTFGVYVTGQMITGYGPRPLARLLMPHPQAPLQSAEPVLRGLAVASGTQRWTVAGEGPPAPILTPQPAAPPGTPPRTDACTWETLSPDTPMTCALRLDGNARAVQVALTPGPDALGDEPGPVTYTLPLQVPPSVHFFVGLARGEVSGVLPREPGDDAVDWVADGAFFYRGVIQGKMLITAGADVQRDVFVDATGATRSWSGVVTELFRHDSRRIFRDLDPEAYYPVYGDSSITVDEREAGGHFFVRVQMDDNYVKWGGINTAIGDAEVGQYVRSLYGLGGRVAVGQDSDPWAARGVFFVAKPTTAAARDELWTTGGSLYFLSHRNVVEGSLRTSLEIMDTVSNLPMRVVPLTEGYDYEADYLGGRINLDASLPTRLQRGTITSRGSGGPRARLIVDYEYIPGSDLTQDWTAGARAVGRWGPVSLGATGVTEITQLGDAVVNSLDHYHLVGGTARLDLGLPLQARLEVAHSSGTSHVMGSSQDGGLTFMPLPTPSADNGTAVALEVSSYFDGGRLDSYGRYWGQGFTDSRTAPGTEIVHGGARAETRLWKGARAWGQTDHREQTPSGSPTMTSHEALLGVAQGVRAFELALEGRYQSAEGGTWGDVTAAVGGAQVSYVATPWLTLLARRRQLVHTEPAAWTGHSETALGADAEKDGWRAGGELGVDDRMSLFGRVQGGAPLTPDHDVYVGYLHNVRLGDSVFDVGQPMAPQSRLLVGGRQRVQGGGALFAEQHLQVDGTDRLLSRIVGADMQLAPGLSGSVAYERASTHTPFYPARERDAVSLGTVWVHGPVSLRLGLDGRLETQAGERTVQSGGQTRLEWRPTQVLTLALQGRGASTYGGKEGSTLQPRHTAWEGDVGAALRPHNDRVQAFARYAITYERRQDAAATAGWLQQASHVAAASAVFTVVAPFSVSPKVAYRLTDIVVQDLVGNTQTLDQALLIALRGDWHVTERWDLGLEGRSCAAPDSELPMRYGALAEASMLAMPWLRLGAGYNFSAVSATGVRCVEPTARGLYVRLETLY